MNSFRGANAPILIAEDDENDVYLISRAFRVAGVPNPIIAVNDGQGVVEYLNGEGRFADRQKYPLPALLLLDLKMPGITGFEFLNWRHIRAYLSDLPIVVLSSSGLDQDIERAREMGAHDYRVKPRYPGQLTAIAQELHLRWLCREAKTPHLESQCAAA